MKRQRRTRRRRPRPFRRRLGGAERVFLSFLIIAISTGIGMAGFTVIEDLPFAEALYMTVHTVSTVGAYNHELSPAGRHFSVVLIMLGMVAVGFALLSINMWLMEGAILDVMGERRIGRQLSALKKHIIVCGAGRIGSLVVEDLSSADVEFVVIDHKESRVLEMLEQGVLAIEGNAADEDVLRQAGIDRADTLVSVVHSDADNLYITMTARSLNADVTIVARAEEGRTVPKLKRVGADRVVAPYHLGALRIANAVLRPAVTDIIEMTQPRSDNVMGLQIAEVEVLSNSRLAGKALRDTSMRQDLGIIVIAVRTTAGVTSVNPEPDQPIEAGSVLVAIGSEEQLDQLTAWARS